MLYLHSLKIYLKNLELKEQSYYLKNLKGHLCTFLLKIGSRDRDIISEYNRFNHKELEIKFNMSKSYVIAIINIHKNSA